MRLAFTPIENKHIPRFVLGQASCNTGYFAKFKASAILQCQQLNTLNKNFKNINNYETQKHGRHGKGEVLKGSRGRSEWPTQITVLVQLYVPLDRPI